MYEVSFGEWLSRRRKAFGLTQRELAEKINCAVVTVRKIEAEQRRPSYLVAERIGMILAVPPSEQKVFIRFARGDWQSPLPADISTYPWRSSDSFHLDQTPVPHTTFIGRESEIARLSEDLLKTDGKLFTIVGAPGVGKSRLASEIVHSMGKKFPDGVFSIPVEAIDEPGALERPVYQALGIEYSQNGPHLAKLKTEIARKRVLFIFDNIEHLQASVAPFVFQLLQCCPQIKIIVTSREPLHIIGELIYHLSPLDLPDESLDVEAIPRFPVLLLFKSCAREFQPGFSISQENLKDVIAICRYLDGLPLAIELLASRIGLMTPQVLLAHLSDNFVLHSSGPRYLGGYHQTLQCAIDRSYDLLSLEERRLFTYLSIFQGEFTLEMVESAFSATPAYHGIADLLSSLIEKSLIQGDNSQNSDPSFRMLNLIHLYATEHLKDFEQDAVTPLHISAPSFIPRREVGW